MSKRKRTTTPTFNPASSWEEETEVEGLTLWDLKRPVCSIITDENAPNVELPNAKLSEFKVPPNKLTSPPPRSPACSRASPLFPIADPFPPRCLCLCP